MAISYVQFITDVSGLGTSFSLDKHSKEWTVEEKGSWFIFTNTRGQRRRIPVTAISAIHETVEDKPATKAAR